MLGGITAKSLKPLEARKQMDPQLAEIKKYVANQGGTVLVMERVRAVRGTQNDTRNVKMDKLPFVLIQRLEAEFPIGVDIDDALERLLQLGLDRYGRNFHLNSGDISPRIVVRYRFSNPMAMVKKIHEQCKIQALQQWCERNVPEVERWDCDRALKKISHRFVTKRLVLKSGVVLGDRGQKSWIQINHPWNEGKLNAIELMGDIPLRLNGTITMKKSEARN